MFTNLGLVKRNYETHMMEYYAATERTKQTCGLVWNGCQDIRSSVKVKCKPAAMY